MAFRFRFETVQKVRKVRENEAKMAFALAQRRVNELAAEKERLSSELETTQKSLMDLTQKGMNSVEYRSYHDYIQGLEVSIERLESLLTEASGKLEEVRGELLKATMELKAVKRLKEIEKKRYLDDQLKREARFIDEIAISGRRSLK